jgi:hypothetical protein
MSEILHVDMDAARFDPEKAFGAPAKLVESIALTRGQKIAALDRWSQQVLDRLKASGEGMPTHRTSGIDLELLEQIRTASESLRKAAPT